MQETSVVFTYDDYLTLPKDGKRYEIVEGELYMTPALSPNHQRTLSHISILFYDNVKYSIHETL